MIKIRNIKEEKHQLFHPNHNSLGFVNVYQFDDVRIQIAKKKLEGYYIMFKNEQININSNGSLDKNPDGFFDLSRYQSYALLTLRRGLWTDTASTLYESYIK